MIHPLTELRAFVTAALLQPVSEPSIESARTMARRRWVSGATLVLGAGTLGWAVRIEPGDSLFYPATMALATVWTIGALVSGPLQLGYAHTRAGGRRSRSVVQSLVLGLLLLAVFLGGAAIVARVPALREPVLGLLDHARYGSLPLVALITAINGVAEELYFRGALFASAPRRHAVALTTLVYALATVPTAIPLLVFAAASLGLLVGLQRRVTGGVLGPIVTHLTWSLGMLFLLPSALELWR
ncbi:MAG TPA: CPBP family intramembrane glutamic endopeptidase [Propionibacteriaceae bacterium]|nr:CPBP family intramembrane glutamic endopeptidase [Propionibacteriaceae bacterium]